MEGNERADKVAKDAATGKGRRTAKWASIGHIKRFVTEARTESITQWLAEKTAGMIPPYIPPGKKGIHPAMARASKDLASRYIQLRPGMQPSAIFCTR